MINKKVFYSTKWIAYTALLTALVVATGFIPGIPVITGKIYWCDFAIYTAAYLMDPLSAMIVGGVGTTFFDLFGINGTAYNAIPSLLIHGLQGFGASLIFTFLKSRFPHNVGSKKEAVIAVLSAILPALWVIFGYFIKRITVEQAAPEVAVLKMPANILQEIVGIGVSVLICYVCRLKDQLVRAHLLPDFRKEVLDKSCVQKSASVTAEGADAPSENSAPASEKPASAESAESAEGADHAETEEGATNGTPSEKSES